MKGKCWKFGDNVNTDEIIPARYLNTSDTKVLAAHCMEDADPTFAEKVQTGDVLVGGENFGCGSSREHAPVAIKGAGVSCVIAKSFARIFSRNAVNIGLAIFESPEAADSIQPGDEVEVDVAAGQIADNTRGETYRFEPFPEEVRAIIEAGGLMTYVRQELGKGG